MESGTERERAEPARPVPKPAPPRRLLFALPLALICALLAPGEVPAAVHGRPESHVCTRAARAAASKTGVPEDVLVAIALTESGLMRAGVYGAWPWTINRAGKGARFERKAEAVAAAEAALARGETNVDIGCFQINYRWHGDRFASVVVMFDPVENALYAARFLARLKAGHDTWADAAASYHSRTPSHAARYRAAFEANLARVSRAPNSVLPVSRALVSRAHPLIGGAAKAASLGSLLPDVPSPRMGSLFSGQEG